MGTNYYLHIYEGDPTPCETCGHCERERITEIHIGKSSGGWRFLFQGYPSGIFEDGDDPVHSLADWVREFEKGDREIRDEYGDLITLEEFLEWVGAKHRLRDHSKALGSAAYLSTDSHDFTDRYFS